MSTLLSQIADIFEDYNKYKINNSSEIEYLKEWNISGWVKECRNQGEIDFINITDGSTIDKFQIVLNKSILNKFDKLENITGATINVTGFVVKSQGKNQLIEMKASNIIIVGPVLNKNSILLAKSVNIPTLREHQHIRPRFTGPNCIFKIRSQAAKSVHDFFHAHKFYNLDPNIITTSDCEGAGEVFTITTLTPDNQLVKLKNTDIPVDIMSYDESLLELIFNIISLCIKICVKMYALLFQSIIPIDPNTITKTSSIIESNIVTDIYKNDFFQKHAYLTVSSQLQLESLSQGLSRVYTFNPSFRAEKSKTTRHLACFTHLEWEIAFIDLKQLMDFSEELVKYVIKDIMVKCAKEYDILDKFASKGIINKLTKMIDEPFERITYTKAIDLINEHKIDILAKNKGVMTIDDIPKWGDDLGSCCEKYICDHIYKKPVFAFNYPKTLKSFYMKLNDDNLTVQSVDLLCNGLGELIGSSIREDSLDKLNKAMDDKSMDKNVLQWYIDLRTNSTFPHGGAGLGFDRLVNLCTLIDGNIRDVVPFPVAFGECNY